ncbi:MAG: hypothetical protein JOZ86_07790 [Candidatus Eremiobacteraeota bacterium]|nr:hypothetical protein [Candidatus Eremiobacteraeota bacterium]
MQDLVSLKHLALEHGAEVHYVAKGPSEMPPYDRIAFYPGESDPGWIWENRGEKMSPMRLRAVNHAHILLEMDSGTAGERWKQLYDALSAEDEAQAPGAPDPYRFRHAFLSDMDAKLAALAPSVPTPTPDPSVDEAARAVSDQDLKLATGGLYKTPLSAKTVRLPSGQWAHYGGRQGDGTYLIERNSLIDEYEFYTDMVPAGSDDATIGTYFEAFVDSGNAGAALKQQYDNTADKARFGLIFAGAFDMMNDRLEHAARAKIDWILKTIHPGMPRSTVQTTLQSRDMRWPETSSELKKYLPDEKPERHVIEFDSNHGFGCGTYLSVAFTFDANGRLANVEAQPPRTVCL